MEMIFFLLLLLFLTPLAADAFSTTIDSTKSTATDVINDIAEEQIIGAVVDRPLLHSFSRGIKKRIRHSKEGSHKLGMAGAYTSDETIPCLDMQRSGGDGDNDDGMSSRRVIREAFSESSGATTDSGSNNDGIHGRSSGSGCSIIRLSGDDAASIHGLVQYGNQFFERVDDDDCNRSRRVKDVGVFQIEKFVYAGFDENVNEGQMQMLDTRIMPSEGNEEDPLLLPLEVGDMVGSKSTSQAHDGISLLMDIGSQITSAVLGMDSHSAEKLIDDGTQRGPRQSGWNDVSNSYHRLIRYINPQPSTNESNAAFHSHVDSSFLTLIPMPELPGEFEVIICILFLITTLTLFYP